MTSIAELLKDKNRIHTEMTSILDLSKREKRDFSDEERAKWDALNADYTRADQAIQLQTTKDKEARTLAADAYVVRTITGKSEDEQLTEAETYKLAFAEYIVRGRDMSPEARAIMTEAQDRWPAAIRQQATSPGSAGGFLTNEEFSNELAVALKRFGGMRQFARTIRTATGSVLNWPLNDETAIAGAIVGENQPIGDQDMLFGSKQIGAFKYTSEAVRISWELLQDSLIDPVSLIQDALVTRLGRIQNTHFTNGVGTTEPEGIVPAAPEVAADAAAAIEAADLYRLFHAVDPAYRADPSAAFMMNDGIAANIREINTGNGIPLWVPSLQSAVPDQLLGKPIIYNADMADTVEALADVILFGAGNRYIIRDVAALRVLRLDEVAALSGQVVFVAWLRTDGAPLVPELIGTEWAVKKLTMAA